MSELCLTYFVFEWIDSDFEHKVVRYIRRLRIHSTTALYSALCLICAFHLLRVPFLLDQVLVPQVWGSDLAGNGIFSIAIRLGTLHRLLSVHTVSVSTDSGHLRLVLPVVFSVSHTFITRMLLEFHFEFDDSVAILLGEQSPFLLFKKFAALAVELFLALEVLARYN